VRAVKLNGNRNITGILRGYDQFMNIVLDETVEHVSATESNDVGMVVRARSPCWAYHRCHPPDHCRLYLRPLRC
jgi:small nuclear ribonucleoprotein G